MFGGEFGVWVSCVQQIFGFVAVVESFKTVLGLVADCMEAGV